MFDNAKAIIIERDIYGPGKHRWNPQLMHVAEKYAFTPKVCRPLGNHAVLICQFWTKRLAIPACITEHWL
ncbi:hypothetical protein BBW68_00930 [Candidatus Erwinia dacicola]|uniref:Uncharacterized protein n=1 Tax=Candidatus Erwinia dacicola TaxID=252393 RepID=A0A1E7Z3V5_9GAMM|nr:hypothetical protein BBW68_00930 [Candidatus Erwinia dacicola]